MHINVLETVNNNAEAECLEFSKQVLLPVEICSITVYTYSHGHVLKPQIL